MPEGRRRLIQALGGMFGQKADKLKLVPALVGAYFNGQKTLKVAGRSDFIWARIRGGTSEVVQVFNDVIQPHWDLPILVYRDPNYPDIWKVYGRDISRYEDWGGINYLPSHATQHAFGGGKTGGDVVWVFKRQFMPLLPHPNATATMSIYVEPDFYHWDGGYVWFGGTGTADLSSYRPTGGANARYLSVYIDGDSGNLLTIAGEEFDAIWAPDAPADLIPVPTPDQGIPITAVLLMTGTSTIGWGELFDIRNIVSPLPVAPTYGEIWTENNTTGTVIPGSSTWTQVKIFGFNGESSNCTPDFTNHHIQIDYAGIYLVTVSASILSGAGAAAVFEAEVRINNGATRYRNIHWDRQLAGGGGDVGSTSMSGLANFAVNDTIEVWVQNKTNAVDVIFEDITLTVTKVDDS